LGRSAEVAAVGARERRMDVERGNKR